MQTEKEILDAYQTTMRFDESTYQTAEHLYNQYKSKQLSHMVNQCLSYRVMTYVMLLRGALSLLHPKCKSIQQSRTQRRNSKDVDWLFQSF